LAPLSTTEPYTVWVTAAPAPIPPPLPPTVLVPLVVPQMVVKPAVV